jgi:hypothetical protein
MNKTISLKAVASRRDIKLVGDFCIPNPDQHSGATSRMDVRVPGGEILTLRVTNGNPSEDGQVWGWNGNITKPTLKPSVKTTHWHGDITDGQLVTIVK